jgi:hypothetical protein
MGITRQPRAEIRQAEPVRDDIWADLAVRQDGMIARRQLRPLGIDRHQVRNQIAARRWASRSSTVISTFTGPLGFRHRLWLGALHAGGDSLVGGLSAATAHGLRRWERDEVSVLVDDQLVLESIPGVRWVRTRRSLETLRDPRSELPLCRLEPALLLFAGYTRASRTAHGVLAAAVQQRLTTPERLMAWIEKMQPLRRAAQFRQTLADVAGGAHSIGELDIARICRRFRLPRPDRQVQRRDAAGRLRYTDCEWTLANGHLVVLEIDGGFHMELEHWQDDIVRERRLSDPGRTAIRCTTRELRDEPDQVVADLRRLGVGAPSPVVWPSVRSSAR